TQNSLAHEGKKRREILNAIKMAMGRIHYETKQFEPAIKHYRSVDKDSRVYYDALFEQSWAFFLAGYPSQALGSLHAVQSPFYQNVFNPEADVLRALIFYWVCDYNASRTALAEFIH